MPSTLPRRRRKLLTIEGLSRDNTYPINKVNNCRDQKGGFSIHNSAPHIRAECKVYLPRSKSKVQCYNYSKDYFLKIALNPPHIEKNLGSTNSEQNSIISMAFS